DGTEPFVEISQSTEPDVASSLFNLDAPVGTVIRLEKLVAYHSSRKVRAEELAFRCERTLNRVGRIGMLGLMENQEEWLER
nr:hypothetical protein [Escherichia coli]